MPITRSYANNQEMLDWTDEIKEIPNQYGVLNGLGLFEMKPTPTTSIAFDRTVHTITLPPVSNRGERKPSTGGRKTTTTFQLPLSFYKHQESVTGQDIQDRRMAGTQSLETLGNVVGEKMELMRQRYDQMMEYMKVQAIKGIVTDTHGQTLTNMFTEFGLSQTTIDFNLDDSNTDVHGKVRELKTAIQKNARTGARVGSIMVVVDPLFFDKLKAHQKTREDFLYYTNANKQVMRDDLATLESFGIVSTFEFQGVLFMAYDAEFNITDATTGAVSTVNAIEADTGYSIVRGVRNTYKHYAGPSDLVDGANIPGSEIYAFQWNDNRGQSIDLEFQAAPLVVLEKPQFSVKVVST